MLVALSAIQEPGEIRVQTFVMAHDARPKIIKSCDNCQKDDAREQRNFDGDRRKSGMDRSLEPGEFIPGKFVRVIHKTFFCILQTSPWNGAGFGGASVRSHARTPKSGYLSRKFPESLFLLRLWTYTSI